MSAIFKNELSSLMLAVAQSAEVQAAEQKKAKDIAEKARQRGLAQVANYRAEIRASILATLKEHGRLGTIRLGKLLGKERSSLFKHLCEMADEGLVVRCGLRLKPEWVISE